MYLAQLTDGFIIIFSESSTSIFKQQQNDEMTQWIGFKMTCVHILAKLGQENLLRMVKWMRWHRPSDTWFKTQALMVLGPTRYLSVTKPLQVRGEETYVSLDTRAGNEPTLPDFSTLPYQVWPSDYQSHLDNRCALQLYEQVGVRATRIFIMTSPVYWL